MKYEQKGVELRNQFKQLVYDYMRHADDCALNSEGLPQAEIFRACGLDWGNQTSATSSQQQYWLVALLRELEYEGLVQRNIINKKWRLK